MSKFRIWRGIAALLYVVFSVIISLSILAFHRSGDVNAFLNIKAPTLDVTEDTNYFPSEFESSDSLALSLLEHNVKSQEEGSVLLKNKNNALPLEKSERSVTLFGNASANPVYKSAAGGASVTNPVSLYEALSNENFDINDIVYNKLKNSGVSTNTDYKGKSPEVPISFYDSNLINSFEDQYNQVAIVTFSRFGGEENDLVVTNENGLPQLALQPDEEDLLLMIKESNKFNKTIVLLNSDFPMELDWLEDSDFDIDAGLWIGNPGKYGFIGVANLLTGKSDFSGSLVNVFASNSLSAPAMRNFGNYRLNNPPQGLYKNTYMVYAEGIYVGYKYYETRYQDQVYGINNATSEKGSYNSGTEWNYSNEVSYPFGYGLSYANFSQELLSVDWNLNTRKVTAKISVSNNPVSNGSTFVGKSKKAVQLYVQLPYVSGQTEKSAIQLLDFAKTKSLAIGEKEIITIEVDDYLFAAYDQKATNGADASKKGAYVFDAGNYYFAIGDDSHDALNNIIESKGAYQKPLTSHTGIVVEGNVNNVKTITLNDYDNTTYAKSNTGEIVYNNFDDADLNYFIPNKVNYLTRDDWNTYPETITDITATAEMRRLLDGKTYEKPLNSPSMEDFKRNQPITIKFIEMRNVDYDDDVLWNKFIDQLTIANLATIIGDKRGNDAIPEIGYPANFSGNGPDGLQLGEKSVLYVSQPVVTATFNKDLIKERGKLMAEEAYVAGMAVIYGPGVNLHRTPYSGRNSEYYSEDAILTYISGAIQVGEMTRKGLLTAHKHFAGNDQEVNRHGVATFMTEQTWREGPLKGFEGSITIGEALEIMTSYNRIGCVPTAASYATMTQVLRNEWGFKGINLTDSAKDTSGYMYTAECIVAGTDIFLNDSSRSAELRTMLVTKKDGYLYLRSREIAKNFFYAYSRSHITNGLTPDVVVEDFIPWWQTGLKILNWSLGSITFLSMGLFIFSAYIYPKIRRK